TPHRPTPPRPPPSGGLAGARPRGRPPGGGPPPPPPPPPHDPETAQGDPPPLTPPDEARWGPAQRRLGADGIALQWAAWREQLCDDDFRSSEAEDQTVAAVPPHGDGAGGAAPAERDGPGGGPGAGPGSHTAVRRVLREARAYLEDPPPPGRVRSTFAPGGARMLRVDGAGWSLVARTDDIAFVLVDELPGEVLPVGRGPRLPGLLAGLDAMAVRPG
ncbi:hypothetical protein, partial [Streptomyces thermolilacinus]|uniref:hypothetical protein n=1 Tax=Streptomyces thermolilacinus TaxID=285540 RepID=UPI003F4CE457